MEYRIASRYAKSAIELANEQNTLEALKDDMTLLRATLRENRPLRKLLTNPIIEGRRKLSVLDQIFSGRFSALTQQLIRLVCTKGREQFLEDIAIEVIHRYNDLKGLEEAVVRTATPLTSSLRGRIATLSEQLSGSKVELREEVDPSVLGGFVLRIGQRQLDRSVAGELTRLKTSFEQA